jgi:hypothetical protein
MDTVGISDLAPASLGLSLLSELNIIIFHMGYCVVLIALPNNVVFGTPSQMVVQTSNEYNE